MGSRKAISKPPVTTAATTTTTTTNTSPSTTSANKAIKIPAKKDEGVDTTGSWPLLGEMEEGAKVDVNSKTKPPKAEKVVVKVKEEEDVEGRNGKANKKKGKC